jgi:hypothetical protein
MDAGTVVTPEPVRAEICACPEPVREVRAARKGAAQTYCSRCDLPVRLDFATR